MKGAQIIVRYLSPNVPACSVEFGDYSDEKIFEPFEDYKAWCEQHCPDLLHIVKFSDSLGTKAWIPVSKFPLLHSAIREAYPAHSMAFYSNFVVFYLSFEKDENRSFNLFAEASLKEKE